MTDEKKIIRLAQGGSVEAFSLLILNYEKRLRSTAYALCSEEADDLLQESFIAAFKSIKRFRGQSSFYTWIYRIMLNLAYKKFRKSKSKNRLLSKLRNNYFNRAHIEEQPSDEELKEELRDTISHLRPKHKEIILLHYFEDLSLKEIANNLSLNENTVKSRLFNARNLIKKEMNLKRDSRD